MSTAVPPIPYGGPMTDQSGNVTGSWSNFFRQVYQRIGGSSSSSNTELDAQITAIKNALVPSGSIFAFGGSTAPTNFLLCDGSAVSRTTYASLFLAIGISHGAGDGSTTFNLPDLRGRFIRGVDGVAARDPNNSTRTAMATGGNAGNAVGSVQGGATALPTTSFSTDIQGSHSSHWSGTIAAVQTGAGINALTSPTGPTTLGAHSHTVTAGGDAETRPINAYENYIIKT